MMKRSLTLTLAVSAAIAMTAQISLAEHQSHGWHEGGRHEQSEGGRGWHGDIRHFERHDLGHWRDGRWRHDRHGGHFGWWWVVGGIWYFYPAPVYPYPDPYVPPVVVQQPPDVVIQQAPPVSVPPPSQAGKTQPPQNWYYCESAQTYYPYVSSCPSGWKLVPATPPGVQR